MKMKIYTLGLNCKYCGRLMKIDDVDFNFDGNQDNYWICPHCGASCFEKIRYGKSISQYFSKGEL